MWVNEGMIRGFNRIIAKYRKRNLRGKGIKLMGIRTLECNFNFKKRTYNPHFHLVVANKEIAEAFINEWLNLWKSNKQIYTVRQAQHMRPIEDLEKDLIETIKYGTKIFTQPDPDKKKKVKGAERIYAMAIYNILNAMKGRHLFEHFGFKIPKASKEKSQSIILANPKEWEYSLQKLDWVNKETADVLTGFLPSTKLLGMVNEIDKISE
jgi:hypothetical protein